MPTASPSLKRNVFANYATQFYVMGIGIVMAPAYLSYMGSEAFGLIGFFTMMAAWFQLLDMGLSPTLVRETARFRGGAIDVGALRALLRVFETIFGFVSLGGAAAIILFANQISVYWLKARGLPIEEVARAVMLMGMAVPLRWMAGLYRGMVNGFERQVWLGGYNAVIATARYVGVLGVFVVLGAAPVYFFAYQLVVALIELGGLVAMTYSLIPRGSGSREKFSWRPLTGNLTFSLAIAFTATAWVVMTQTDKLVLSKWLTLAEFGTFSVAIVAAGAINALGIPFGQALLPRLTKLVAESDEAGVAMLYSRATQAVCVLVAPSVAVLTFFAEQILRAWTGRPEIAHEAAPILCLYAIGNGWIALSSFAYYIQYAKGDLRLHFIGNAILVGLLTPLIIWGGARYGAVGTGAAWAAVNGLYALGWIPIVHARVFKGQHMRWMMHDVIPVILPTVVAAWLLAMFVRWYSGRLATVFELAGVGAILFLVSCIGASAVRDRATTLLEPWISRVTKEQA